LGFRIDNTEFRDAHKAVMGVLYRLLQSPDAQAIIRVPDEDSAIRLTEFIQEAVDRIRIEFDGSEKGPNPLISAGQLVDATGKVIFTPDFGQTLHTDGFEAKP
jgi:hypothetical protein